MIEMRMLSRSGSRLVAVALLVLAVAGCERESTEGASTELVERVTQEPPHRGFESPNAALQALVAAAEADDIDALERILGPGGDSLVRWGDPVAEKGDRTQFVAMFREQHRIVDGEDGQKVAELGQDEWPFPAPLFEREGQWYFDGAEGADELVYRRIGSNELGAIEVAHGFVDAQYEYASKRRDGNIAGLFAAFLISDPGRQNGLYWPAEGDEPKSPAGPFVAAAAGEGYRRAASGEPTPYHGYFYRMLYAQGPNARDGAKDYFVAGRMVEGFAMIAWPAEYGVSGVKTFTVNQDGIVYEKDLGELTPSVVNEMRTFDPDDSWSEVRSGEDD